MLHILHSSNAQWVLSSMLTLGVAAGMVGCLSFWKKQSLMSDALSHAALPGVVIVFMIIGVKILPLLIAGAAVSAVIGMLFIHWVQANSRISEDTAMGIVLSVFFGLGIMLLTIVNRTAGGNQSGLDNFIFGQAATMLRYDVYTMMGLALIVIAVILLMFREWKVYLFDAHFAKGIGLSVKLMDLIYMVLLVTTIVIGIQAVGVILMAALLIIPAVSARYWTHQFKWMMVLSGLFGGGAGVIGTMISAWGNGLPTGPIIVVTSGIIFVISLFLGKAKGLLALFLEQRISVKAKRMKYDEL